MRIKWLQISDLHFNLNSYNTANLRKDLIARIRSLGETENFTHLFLTGDLLDKNQDIPENLYTFILEIIEAMKIELKNVNIVPGNHDKNRISVESIIKSIYVSKDIDKTIEQYAPADTCLLLDSFNKFFDAYRTIIGVDYYLDKTNPHIIVNDSEQNISIIKLNTTWLENNFEEHGILRCGSLQLLDAIDRSDYKLSDTFNIAIGHHPLEEFNFSEKNRILDQFKRNNISVYLAGHSHKSSALYYSEYDVVQLTCAGAINDGYSVGGYIIGTIDTDIKCYKAEYFMWNDGWYNFLDLNNFNKHGVYYFNTCNYRHVTNMLAVDFKLYNGHIGKTDLEEAIGHKNFELIQYPYSKIDVADLDWYMHKKITSSIAMNLIDYSDKMINIFPLAPIPLLILLGYELQNNFGIKVFQHNREANKWVYNSTIEENNTLEIEEINRKSKTLVIKISTSQEIRDFHISPIIDLELCDVVSFKASKISLGCPLYKETVGAFMKTIFTKLDQIVNAYVEIHLFASVPAGLALELGRRIQKGVYPKVHLYNYKANYEYVFTIND